MQDRFAQQPNRFANFLFASGLILYLTISPPLLTVLGIPYDAPSGNFIFKIHIGTYLIVVAYLIAHCQNGSPLRSLLHSLNEQRALALYLGTQLFLLLYSISRYGPSGSAFIIDTLIMPAIGALMLLMFDDATKRKYFWMVIVLVTINAVIGIIESVLQARLVAYTVAGGVVLHEDVFRSTALLGHPLNNALIAGPVMIAALVLRLRPAIRIALFMVLLLGLLSFGGRTAFFFTCLIMTTYFGSSALAGLMRGRYNYTQITGALVVSLFVLGALAGLVLLSGLGERIFAHLGWDDSASVRVQIWRVFDYMSTEDLFLGLSPTDIETITYRLKLTSNLEAIENFWLVMLMQMGLVVFVIFVVGLFSGMLFLWRRSGLPGRLSIVLFFAVASSNNSLASKTCALAILFITWIGATAYARAAPRGNSDATRAPHPTRKPLRPRSAR